MLTGRIRVKSKVRFTIFLVVMILMMTSLISAITGASVASSSSTDQFQCVEIGSGDTIWAVAEKYGPEGTDVRKVVYDICEANDMDASELKAGQMILVPVY